MKRILKTHSNSGWIAVFLLCLLPNSFAHAKGEHWFQFEPSARSHRYSLVDELGTASIINSEIYPGFSVLYSQRVFRRFSYLTFAYSQAAIKLQEPSNATLESEEILTLSAAIFYEYQQRTFKFRLGPEYQKEFFILIQNNEVSGEPLQSIYAVTGFYLIGRFGRYKRIELGADYGFLASTSQINNQTVSSPGFAKLSLALVFQGKKTSWLISAYYKYAQFEVDSIEQTVGEANLGLGIRF